MSSGGTHVSYAADPPSLAMQPYTNEENPFHAFFGEPTKYYKTSAYDKKRKSTWTLPDAYVGKSAMLGEIIEVLTLTDSNWYTKVAMPIERRDDTSVQWNRWEYDPMLAPIVPELGVVRLVQSHRIGRTETFVRRGVGFQVEHGFMNTAEGVRHYVTQLLQLQQSIVETNNFGVLHAYLTATDYNRTWERNHGVYSGKRIKHVLGRERQMWGILQQQPKGIEVLDAQLTETMNRYRARADMWIFPPKIQMYLEVVPNERTEYRLAGAVGPKRLVDGPEGFTSLKGSKVFLTRTFEVDERGPIDHMRFPTQIGEYYEMFDENKYHNYSNYQSNSRDIRIYDEENDKWHVISAEWALENSHMFDEDGEMAEPEKGRYNDNFAKNDKESRLPSYHKQADGSMRKVKYFGQVDERYTDVGDIYNLAQTALNGMVELGDEKTVQATWKSGIELVQQMEQIPYSDSVEAYLTAMKAANTGALERTPSNVKCPPTVEMNEWAPQPHGTLTLPAYDPAWGLVVPPMMQSAAGFRAMAEAYNRNVFGGWNSDAFKAAADFTRLISALVQALRRIFPNNLVTDALHASSWWHRPKAEDTLFENLIVNHRPPAWLSTVTPATGGAAGDVAALASALTDISKTSAAVITQNILGNADVDDVVKGRVKNLVDNFKPTYTSNADIRNESNLQLELRRAYVLKTLVLVDTTDAQGKLTKVLNELAVILNTTGDGGPTANSLFDIGQFAAKMSSLSGVYKSPGAKRRVTSEYAKIDRVFQNVRKNLTPENVQRHDGSVPNIDVSVYRRAPLVFSPTMMATLSAFIATGRVPQALPSDLNSLDVVVTVSALDEYTRAFNTGSMDGAHPYMQTYASMQTQLSVENVALVMNARNYMNASNTSSSAAFEAPVEEFDAPGASSFRRAKRNRPLGTHMDDGMMSSRKRHGISSMIADCSELVDELVTDNFSRLFSKLGQERSQSILRVIAQAFMFTPLHKRAYLSFLHNNVLLPVGFVIVRPHARYHTLAGIKALAGKETGTTFVGPSIFEVGDDAAIGVHLGSYKYYSASIVTNPKNVFVARNIFIDEYLGGMGVGPYTLDTYHPRQNQFGDGSIFVLAVPYNERALHTDNQMPNPFSITGSFEYLQLHDYNLSESSDLHYSTAYQYNALWGWASMGAAEEIEESRHYSSRSQTPNYAVYRGHTWYRNKDGAFNVVSVGTGHWGSDSTYLGCKDVRNGQMRSFKEQNYNAYQQL